MVYFLIVALLIIGVFLMTIYFGNKKIGKLNFGGISIGEVYKGNQLVYQSGPSLKLYGLIHTLDNANLPSYLVGSYSTSGKVTTTSMLELLSYIEGSLGQSGSVIGIRGTLRFSYADTSIINGIKVYRYNADFVDVLVMDGSTVGSYVLGGIGWFTPTSVTNTTVVLPAGWGTCTRDATRDATWTLSGIK